MRGVVALRVKPYVVFERARSEPVVLNVVFSAFNHVSVHVENPVRRFFFLLFAEFRRRSYAFVYKFVFHVLEVGHVFRGENFQPHRAEIGEFFFRLLLLRSDDFERTFFFGVFFEISLRVFVWREIFVEGYLHGFVFVVIIFECNLAHPLFDFVHIGGYQFAFKPVFFIVLAGKNLFLFALKFFRVLFYQTVYFVEQLFLFQREAFFNVARRIKIVLSVGYGFVILFLAGNGDIIENVKIPQFAFSRNVRADRRVEIERIKFFV